MEKHIAKIVSELSFDKLNNGHIYYLKRNIIDSYGAICCSLKDKTILKNFENLSSGIASGSDIDIWGIGKRGTYADGIFLNSILSRRSDLLSTYFSVDSMGGIHPSDNVALVLTLADLKNFTGKELLLITYTSFLLSGIFAEYYDPEKAKFDHDAAALFYTALIIGRTFGLSEEKLTETQRIAGMLGLDVNQTAVGNMTDWKHCTYASCALRGFTAARLAAAGFKGPEHIYDGEAGINYFLPHLQESLLPRPDLSKIILKRWPALVFCQTPIDVAMDISKKLKDPDSVKTVIIKTYSRAFNNGATVSSYSPSTRAARTHSIPYCAAAALLKTIEYEDFDEPYSHNPILKRLMSKIKVEIDPEYDKSFPAYSKCKINIQLKDGSKLQAERDYPIGDPKDPLSDTEIENKIRKYFFFSKNDNETEEVIRRLWNLENEKDLTWLLNPLKRKVI